MIPGEDTGKGMALEGLKVLDFTWVAVGPITIKYLADNGATVIRVESVSRRDDLRGAPPSKDGVSGDEHEPVPGKLQHQQIWTGVEYVQTRVPGPDKEADRGLAAGRGRGELYAAGQGEMGLDYESLKKLKEDIILFSACQQGQTGPKAAFAGFGMQAAAHAGFYHLTGWPDRLPLPPYGAYSDFINPPNGAAAILAALEYRNRTGKGST